MASAETGRMCAIETGKMIAAETSVLSQQKTSGPEACQDRSGAFGTGLTHSKGPSGRVLEVQVGSTMSVRAEIIENGSKWVQNRRFGLK